MFKKRKCLVKTKELLKIFFDNWEVFFENKHFENFFFKIIEIRLKLIKSCEYIFINHIRLGTVQSLLNHERFVKFLARPMSFHEFFDDRLILFRLKFQGQMSNALPQLRRDRKLWCIGKRYYSF